MRDQIILYVNGSRHTVGGSAAFQPLSSFLRYQLGLTGTKVVCAEGDCGSCAVLIGRASGGEIQYNAATSCIQYLYQLDAAHVITVEGLMYDGDLNPFQEAMVANHGAQCGFCTPGFIVTTCGLFEHHDQLTDHELRRGLVGNLCRCTGYESIMKAGLAIESAQMRRLNALYSSAEMLSELNTIARESVLIHSETHTFYKPVALNDAVRFRGEHPGCTIIAGGTDLGVFMRKGKAEPSVVLSMAGLSELRGIHVTDSVMTIGATATLMEWQAACRDTLPAAWEMLERFGSPLIRQAATLAGNIANGSPIGDAMPLLFVFDAAVELVGPQGTRQIPINEFYTGYRKTVMRHDELIARIAIPLPPVDSTIRFYKVSKREDLDISTFAAAFRLDLDGNIIRDCRIALGGVAATIIRLPSVEIYLTGKSFTKETLREAGELASAAIRPISDVRGSEAYRLQLARNMFLKLHSHVAADSCVGH